MYTFTYDPGVKPSGGTTERSPTNAADSVTIGRLHPCVPAIGSTTFPFAAAAPRPVNDSFRSLRTTMAFDRSIGLTEPASCRTTTAFTKDCTSLRSLIANRSATARNAQPCQNIEAILLHPDFTSKVERAARKASPKESDPVQPDDLAQQAELRLLERMSKRRLSYEDRGEPQFQTWIGAVVTRAVLKAKNDCTPKVATLLVGDMSRFPVAVTRSEEAELIEELRAAIPKIPYVNMRHAIEDQLAGLTNEESAALRGLSKSHISDLRGHGELWLRYYFSRD